MFLKRSKILPPLKILISKQWAPTKEKELVMLNQRKKYQKAGFYDQLNLMN
jgi:hypothetical protein